MKKKAIYFLLIIAIVFMAFCPKSNPEFVREDLIGTWEKTEKIATNDQIIEFTLNADSTAILKIKSIAGIDIKEGTWESNYNINVLKSKITLKGDLKIKYWRDENNLSMVLLKVHSDNKFLTVKLNGSEFRKKL